MVNQRQISESEYLALLDAAALDERRFLKTSSGPTGLWIDLDDTTNKWAGPELARLRQAGGQTGETRSGARTQ